MTEEKKRMDEWINEWKYDKFYLKVKFCLYKSISVSWALLWTDTHNYREMNTNKKKTKAKQENWKDCKWITNDLHSSARVYVIDRILFSHYLCANKQRTQAHDRYPLFQRTQKPTL